MLLSPRSNVSQNAENGELINGLDTNAYDSEYKIKGGWGIFLFGDTYLMSSLAVSILIGFWLHSTYRDPTSNNDRSLYVT